jgi:hypothetical protein
MCSVYVVVENWTDNTAFVFIVKWQITPSPNNSFNVLGSTLSPNYFVHLEMRSFISSFEISLPS